MVVLNQLRQPLVHTVQKLAEALAEEVHALVLVEAGLYQFEPCGPDIRLKVGSLDELMTH